MLHSQSAAIPGNLETAFRAYNMGLLQGKAYSRLHTQLSRALYQHGLSIPEWKLMGQVFEQGSVKLSVLAELLDYDPPMVTKLIKQLEKKLLVVRKQDAEDERAKIISLTKEGGEIIEKAEPEVKKLLHTILGETTPEELATYIKVLQQIIIHTVD